MPKIDQGVINFDVYEDGVEYFGMAKVTLPKIANLTNTISGAGIGGNVEVVTRGLVDTMSMKLEFRSMTAMAINLAKPGPHLLELRVAQQTEENTTLQQEVAGLKYVATISPKGLDLGTLAPNSTADVSGEYSCSSIMGYYEGELWLNIDPYNNLYVIKGVDYSADVRKALGK